MICTSCVPLDTDSHLFLVISVFFSEDDSLLEEEEELGSDRGSGLKLYSLSICEDSLSLLLSSVITNSAMVSISNPPESFVLFG